MKKPNDKSKLFVVRLYDGFDNEWMDVSGTVSEEEAKRVWNEMTKNGTQKTKFDDIDYYRIFLANTVMRYSEEGQKLREV